jgi:hypothetical protein
MGPPTTGDLHDKMTTVVKPVAAHAEMIDLTGSYRLEGGAERTAVPISH